VDVVVVLAGGAAEIDLVGARAKVGMRQAQTDIRLAGDLADVIPAGPDLGADALTRSPGWAGEGSAPMGPRI